MFQTEIRIPFFSPVSGLRGCFSANGTDLYRPVCSQNLELVNLVPESRLPFSTYIVPFTLKRTGRPETGIKYLNERGEGISFFALFGLRNIKQRNPGPISPVSHPFKTLTFHPTFLARVPYPTLRLFSPASAPLISHTQLGHVTLLELNQRRFWATFLNRKWAIFILICPDAPKFVWLCVFTLIETIWPNVCWNHSSIAQKVHFRFPCLAQKRRRLNSLAQTKTTCMRFFPTFQTLKK